MRTELENLRQALTSPERKSSTTIENYLIAANRFLKFTSKKLPPSKSDLKRFFAQQKEDDIGPRTQNYYFIVIQQLYEANSWVWPLSRNDRPEIPKSLPINVFTVDEIKTLIENRQNYSKEELINCLLKLNKELGKVPIIKDLAVRKDYPEATVYKDKFGSWNKALEAAGLEVKYLFRRWTKERK